MYIPINYISTFCIKIRDKPGFFHSVLWTIIVKNMGNYDVGQTIFVDSSGMVTNF